jgi:hypothetical protein
MHRSRAFSALGIISSRAFPATRDQADLVESHRCLKLPFSLEAGSDMLLDIRNPNPLTIFHTVQSPPAYNHDRCVDKPIHTAHQGRLVRSLKTSQQNHLSGFQLKFDASIAVVRREL